MDTKIRFGIDYLNIMTHANIRSGTDFNWRAYRLSKMLLCWEWGFTIEEIDETNRMFFQMNDSKSLEELSVVGNRVISHLQKNETLKTQFVIDMMMVNLMDAKVSESEKQLTIDFADSLDFRKSEISQMADKAEILIIALSWYAENYNNLDGP